MRLQNSCDLGGYNFKTTTINRRIGSTTEPDEAIGINTGKVCGGHPVVFLRHLIRSDLQYSCLTCGKYLPSLLVNNAKFHALVGTTHTTCFVITELFFRFQSPAANGT